MEWSMEKKLELEQIAAEIHSGLDADACDKAAWVRRILRRAELFAEARSRFKANAAFSDWIREAKLDRVNADDRAALLHIAENPEVARQVLEKTESRSTQLVWRNEIQPRVHLRNVTKTAEPDADVVRLYARPRPFTPSGEAQGPRPEPPRRMDSDLRHRDWAKVEVHPCTDRDMRMIHPYPAPDPREILERESSIAARELFTGLRRLGEALDTAIVDKFRSLMERESPAAVDCALRGIDLLTKIKAEMAETGHVKRKALQ